jgi:hypothetical protein
MSANFGIGNLLESVLAGLNGEYVGGKYNDVAGVGVVHAIEIRVRWRIWAVGHSSAFLSHVKLCNYSAEGDNVKS